MCVQGGGGVCVWGVCVSRGGMCLGGVFRECVCPEGSRGVHTPRTQRYTPLDPEAQPPVNRMTDRCKNITFPQLCLRAVIRQFKHCVIPPSIYLSHQIYSH